MSVLMAVRDGAAWVGDAIDSVLGQTDGDLELIVVDDGSTDATPSALAARHDPRLRVTRQEPSGLTRALNRALGMARADLVARLDADDLSRPERHARQRAFLAAHPAVGLLGTAAIEIDASGRQTGVVRPPLDDASLRRILIRKNPFVHSSVMARRALVERAGGYDDALAVAQDYDLWLRLARITRLANLAEPLVVRRLVAGRVGLARDDDRLRTEMRVRWRAVRAGAYPWWCVVFAARAAAALVLPRPLRAALRRAAGRAR